MRNPAMLVDCRKFKVCAAMHDARCVPAEVPVAFVYDGSTYAVMMASPSDLDDFALGFSLAEGIVSNSKEIVSLDVIEQDKGIELRLWLSPDRGRNLAERRRHMAGPTGCGLCGVESLDAAVPSCPRVSSTLTVTPDDIGKALVALPAAQVLHRETHAVHGAGFWSRAQGLLALAEDVGRHNALDKLVGRLRREAVSINEGIVLLTSRVSVEMVQKAAVAGAPIVAAVSVPTALALETADQAGITLVAIARADGFEVFTHPHRIMDVVAPANKRKAEVERAA